MTDPNLDKIKEANRYDIIHGRVQRAIQQADNYLLYVIGFNLEKKNVELNQFINEVKTLRRQSRGQKR